MNECKKHRIEKLQAPATDSLISALKQAGIYKDGAIYIKQEALTLLNKPKRK